MPAFIEHFYPECFMMFPLIHLTIKPKGDNEISNCDMQTWGTIVKARYRKCKCNPFEYRIFFLLLKPTKIFKPENKICNLYSVQLFMK